MLLSRLPCRSTVVCISPVMDDDVDNDDYDNYGNSHSDDVVDVKAQPLASSLL